MILTKKNFISKLVKNIKYINYINLLLTSKKAIINYKIID